ncbi:spore wall synthesis complex protein [Ornithinimicrobium humiphilum]|uniref:DUF3040 family protein n=1 Tax=Ornithinimicrobium humiphilum TaxID=125288 RepID=A0A543KN49_9MICO|nr:DUF3040 domain-containing protein [Ornithinimicrobium humiphilum]TQM96508.1 DUF3040 family protein [Ornithinimicrobium humiphilum]
MPLSEHEQRVLAQMEQALYAEDPRLATTLKSSASASGHGLDRRRVALGVLGAVVGLGLVVLGVMSQMIWVGAIGFLLMVLGGAWAAKPPARPKLGVVGGDGKGGGGGGGRRGPRGPRPSGGSFMERMEQQWDKRREQGL